MSDRQLVIEAVQQMPENLTIREILDELALMETVRARLEKNPQGKGVLAEELLQQVASWVDLRQLVTYIAQDNPRRRPGL